MGLLFERESYEVRGCVFDVRKQLGTGWSEEVYHQALVRALQEKNISVKSKLRCPMFYRHKELHQFEPDIIVWNKIVIELKVLPYARKFAGPHYTQLISYLKFFECKLGFLVNFGPMRAKIERVIWAEQDFALEENYDDIKGNLLPDERQALNRVRNTIISLGEKLGFGYPETLYHKALCVEFEHQRMKCLPNITLNACWHGDLIARHHTNHLLVSDKFLVKVRSLINEPPSYEFARLRTFLKESGLHVGLIVNFGKKSLQIFSIKV